MPPAERTHAGPSSLSLLAALSLLLGQACWTAGGNQVAATVDGQRITFSDIELHEWLSRDDWPSAETAARPAGWRLHALRQLIDQRILLRRAKRRGVEASSQEVEEAVRRRRAAAGDDDALDRILASNGASVDRLREHLRRALTIEHMIRQEASSKVRVRTGEMRAYYDAHEAAFSVYEQQLRLAQILVGESTLSPIPNLRNDDVTGPEAALEKIRWIRDQLQGGADFETLAQEYSEDPLYAATGGDMGFVPLSAMDGADIRLRRAIGALRAGQQSDIIKTDGEYRILRLISVEEAGQRSFDDPEVQDAIREVLANRKEQLLREAIYEIERNRSRIRNHLAERLAADPDAGP